MTDQQTPSPGLAKGESAAALSSGARRVHQSILAAFAHTGQAPTGDDLEQTSRAAGLALSAAMAELADRDLVVFEPDGRVRAAYPFASAPTPHRVAIDGGGTVYAMCAIDALGMSAMLGRRVTITSTEPGTGQRVIVTVDGEQAEWSPPSTVVFAGATGDRCAPSAERTCGHINFFTTTQAARAWAARHPDITGPVLDQRQALASGVAEFGALLREPNR